VGSAVFTLTVEVAAGVANGTVLSNTATVSSATPDPGGPQDDTETTTVDTGLEYYTMAPCRLVDTRAGTPAPLAAGETRSFDVTGGPCLVPDAAKVVALNVTSVSPATVGYIVVFKAGLTPVPGAGFVVSLRPGVTRANNGMVALADDGSGQLSVHNAAAGPVDVVIDAMGYFLVP
jgi:hypothetical protein